MKASSRIGILGVGKALPEKLVPSAEVERQCGLPEGTIAEKTGVLSRYVASDTDTASDLSARAASSALSAAKISAQDLGVIVACTFTADYVMPALACKVHQLIGAKRAAGFDLMANCTGFQMGLSVADSQLSRDPELNCGLVIGAALQSRYVNWKEPNSCMYFGDGAGAAVLGPVPEGYGFLSHEAFTNSTVYEAVRIRGGGSSHPMRKENVDEMLQYYEINGMEVWKQVVQYQPQVVKRALDKADLHLEEVDFFIFHQANKHLIEYLMGKMKLPLSKTFTNVEKVGNTAEASMAIALCEAVENGLITRGSNVVVSGVGAGFTFGASVLRWY